jgi:O-antigen/teichoic acid export membrane protein
LESKLTQHSPETRSGRAIAKGTLKLSAATLTAMVCGLGLQLYLARALQPYWYGVLAVVTSVIVWWETVGTALLQTSTAQFVARAGLEWKLVAGMAIRTTFVWGVLLAAACVAVTPLIARALGDLSFAPYLWLFSLDLLLFPLYQTLLCILNGRRQYGYQARAAMVYWVGKLGLVCGLVALGLSIHGAILGSIGASALGLACAWRWSGIGLPPRDLVGARQLILFGLPLMGLTLLYQIMTTMDLWCVKALLANPEAPGHFGVAKCFFQMFISISWVMSGTMLPALTQAIAEGNQPSCREVIEQSFRFVFILTLLGIVLFGSQAEGVMTLFFSTSYAAAAAPCVLLVIAALMFSLRHIGNTALVAAGKPRTGLWALAPLVPLNIALNVWAVPRYGLIGAAAATALTGALAAGFILLLVWREFHVLFAPGMLFRTILAAGTVYSIGLHLPAEGLLVLPNLVVLSGLFVLLLFILGEVRKSDFELLMFWRTGAVPEVSQEHLR